MLFIGLFIFLTGCGNLTNEEIIEKTEKQLKEMKSYQCTLEIKVTGNKGSQEYEIKQFFQSPDSYRLETLSPKQLEGKTTIFQQGKAKIYHPHIDQSIIIENFEPKGEEVMFLGDFLKWDFDKETKIEEKVQGEQEYLVLTREIAKGSYYHHKQSLWIHKKDILPRYIKIYDQEGNPRIEITIKDFKIAPEFDKMLFEIEK